jgi:signal peptidase
MKKIAKVLRGALAALAFGAAVLLGLSFAPTLLGYESFIVTSGSMGKANPIGSVAVTRMVDVKAIREGDAVSFQTESASRITHRVIEVKEDQGQRVFTTKGDANPLPDPQPLRLTSGKIARVQWSVPYAGYLVRYARTPTGGILLFAVPILGLILDKRSRPQGRSGKASQTGKLPGVVLNSSLYLSCSHCGEGVALGLVPLQAQKPPLNKPTVSGEIRPDHVIVPKVTWPEPEVVSINGSGTPETAPEPKANGYREWNFPLQPAGNGASSKNGGSSHA